MENMVDSDGSSGIHWVEHGFKGDSGIAVKRFRIPKIWLMIWKRGIKEWHFLHFVLAKNTGLSISTPCGRSFFAVKKKKT